MRFAAAHASTLKCNSSRLEFGKRDPNATADLYALEIEALLGNMPRSSGADGSTDREACTTGLMSQLLAVLFVASSVCWSGYAVATNFLTPGDSYLRSEIVEPTPRKADQLPVYAPLSESALRVQVQAIRTQSVEAQELEAEDLEAEDLQARELRAEDLGAQARVMLNDADLLEPLMFRGRIEDVSVVAHNPVLAPARRLKPKRSPVPMRSVSVVAESPQPKPQPPSLFEKLFGLRFPSS
jgi:hypothetical protein